MHESKNKRKKPILIKDVQWGLKSQIKKDWVHTGTQSRDSHS